MHYSSHRTEHNKLLLKLAPIGFFEADANGNFTYINPKWTKITGFTEDETLGSSWLNTVYEYDREKVIEEWENSKNEKREFKLEFRFLKKDGKFVWVSANANGILDENKNIIGYAGSITDITDLKNIQLNLLESEKKYKKIINEAGDVIYTVDYKGNFTFINARVEKLTGYSEKELLGKNFTFLVDPDWMEKTKEFYHKQFKEKISETVFEFPFITKGGKRKWVEQTVMMLNEGERISGFECIVRDITSRREEQILNIIESISDGFVALDSAWRYTYVNNMAAKLLGKSTEELIGKNIWEVFPEGINQPFYNYYMKAMNEKVTIQFEEHYLPWDRWFENRVYPSANGITIYFKEITEQKIAEKIIKDNENQLDLIYNATSDVIYLLSVEEGNRFKFISVNQALLNAMGLKKEQVEGKFIEEITPEAYSTKSLARCREVVKAGHPIVWEDISDPSEKRTGKTTLSPIFNEEKVCVKLLGTIHDTTDQKEAEKKLNEKNIQIAESKLMALRSAMNPHFLFNSLNSIQYFVAKNERRIALDYLSMFSSLIRKILKSSVSHTVPLATELEILREYITLEKVRFEGKFDYLIEVDPDIEIQSIEIPSLLIQPYVENSILHGLMKKDEEGFLKIKVTRKNDFLYFIVEDNGIGIEKANQLKETRILKEKSYGMELTKERLEIINKTSSVSVNVEDLKNIKKGSHGTRVTISIKIDQSVD